MTKILGVSFLFILFLLQTTHDNLHAQYLPRNEFGNLAARRRDNLDTNNVRTSLRNFGYLGRTGAGQGNPMEWPKNTNRDYIALASMFVGGQVIDANGDTVRIVSVPAYRTNLSTGGSWNFEPVPQYLNPASPQIARSDDPDSWPSVWIDKMSDPTDPGWPGSWNGFFGRNVFIDGTEFYYHYSDNLYDRYNFYPDSTNLARRGLGIVISERVMEFNNPIVNDALLVVSDIYNVGTSPINRAAVTIWVADFVGGDGDSQDDRPTYDLGRDFVYFNDGDGHSSNPAFEGVRVGTPTLAFILTPQNLGITNLQYLAAGSINFNVTPDQYFWNTFMVPGSFFDPNSIPVGESDLFASCGFFSLPSGGSERLITGWVFSEDSLEGRRKAGYLKIFVAGGYSANGVSVAVLSPTPGQVVSGQVPIQWNAENNNLSLQADILFSSDDGDNWMLISEVQPNDGNFVWDTDSLDDGVFYKIRVIIYDSTRIGYKTMEGSFTLNNSQSAPPQIRLNGSLVGQTYQSPIPVEWIGGDADGDTVHVSLSYRFAGSSGWISIASGLPNSGSYLFNTLPLPNSAAYWLKADMTDGTLHGIDSLGELRILNPRHGLWDSAFVFRNTIGTGTIQPHIVDSTQVTGHRYTVDFSLSLDSVTTYNVLDENTGLNVVSNATEVFGTVEGPLFDGVRLLVRNDSLTVNRNQSGWQRNGIYDFNFRLFRFGFVTGAPELDDYRIDVGQVGLDTSVARVFGGVIFPSQPVNFRITNIRNNQRVPFAFKELDGTDGRFTSGWNVFGFPSSDFIVFLTRDMQDSLVASWSLGMVTDSVAANPIAGDTLKLKLSKPFQTGDRYRFDAITGPLLGVREKTMQSFSLMQNYPNPFNPSTEIRFSLGHRQTVELEIYDILGRHVRSLVNETLPAGDHIVRWDGRNERGYQTASGVYLYRLRAGSFAQTRKLLLLR